MYDVNFLRETQDNAQGNAFGCRDFFIDFPLFCFCEENRLKRDLPLVFQAACFLNLASVLSGQSFTMGDFCYLLQYKSFA